MAWWATSSALPTNVPGTRFSTWSATCRSWAWICTGSSSPIGPAMPLREDGTIDIRGILDILPHRYPLLLIDRVLEIQAGKTIVAIKNVSANEPFFQGHWPGRPIMPGVLIIEAMAQAGGVLVAATMDRSGRVAMLASVDG